MHLSSKRQKLKKLKIQNIQPKQANFQTNQSKISDSRFSSVHFDPKFVPISKKQTKVKLDSRFSNVLTDDRFRKVAAKDKYGRDLDINDGKELENLYYLEEKIPESTKDKKKIISSNKKTKKTDIPSDTKKVQIEEIKNKYYNNEGKFEWNEESSSDSEENSQIEEENLWDDDEENVIRAEESSNKLALLNYDWTRISAEDLMILFNSLKPINGLIKSITIYPSDFGLKRLAEEELEGPKHIWKDKQIEEKKDKKKTETLKEVNEWIAKDDEETDFDPIKLRKYEKERLKYYYAIILCDTKETAEHIYKESDGAEFELTGLKLDLRFVPNTTEFPHQPKEICDYIPTNSKIGTFLNRAINHTNVKLTWEEPDIHRFDFLYDKKNMEKDWENVDFTKVLGDHDVHNDSLSENDEQNDNESIENNKNNLNINNNEDVVDWKQDFDKKKNRNNDMDMEITFATGFSEKMEKKKDGEKSLWQKYLEKKKEKKKERNLVKKKKMNEDDYFIEPEQIEIEKNNEDELNLLVDDKTKNINFKANIDDNRFKAIYEDSKFGIDPTNKAFTIEGSGKYLKEHVNRRKKIKKI